MQKTMKVVVYRNNLRYVVGEALVNVDDNMDIDWTKAEINITHPTITEQLSSPNMEGFSIAHPS